MNHYLRLEKIEFATRELRSHWAGRRVGTEGVWEVYLDDELIEGGESTCEIHMDFRVVSVRLSDGSEFSIGDWAAPKLGEDRWMHWIRGVTREVKVTMKGHLGPPKTRKLTYQELAPLKPGDIILAYRPFRWVTEQNRRLLTNGEVNLPAHPTVAELGALGFAAPPRCWSVALQRLDSEDVDDWQLLLREVLDDLSRNPVFHYDVDADGREVLTDGLLSLPVRYPSANERQTKGIPAVGETGWPLVLQRLDGKMSRAWQTVIAQVAWDFILQWDGEGSERRLTNGAYNLAPRERLDDLPWGGEISHSICPPGTWSTFLEALSGRRPSQTQDVIREFARRPAVPFHWVTEGGADWLTNGLFSFPRQYPRLWASYKHLIRPIKESYWAPFLASLAGKLLNADDILPYRDAAEEGEPRAPTERQERVQGIIAEQGKMWDGAGANEVIALSGGTVIFTVERPDPLGRLYVLDNPDKGAIYFFASREEAERLATGEIGRSEIRSNQLHLDHREGWEDELCKIIQTVRLNELTV